MPGTVAELALGLGTGIAFGFLLQKGRASRHEVVVGQFLLRDFTLLKIFATAIAVGAVGVWAMATAGLTTVAPAPAELARLLAGGVVFGIGLVVLGYGPGGALAAAGEGKRDGRVGVAGMVFGGFVYVVTHDVVVPALETLADLGPITWPSLTRSSPWLWVAGVGLVASAIYAGTRARLRRAHRVAPHGPRGDHTE